MRWEALAAVGAALAVPAYALAMSAVPALDGVERGRWTVRELDSGRARPAVCLGDPVQLVQLAHPGPACPIELIENGKTGATAQYSCPGRGFGHTHVRVETPRLVRIDTQGLSNGRPFSFRFEATRSGGC